ncbi:MAG TPA: NIPSNAP family protein [Vicinamibacteria bacterium]|nr:NIPSNAP family protein [Vicinamibacteria bacterium]
MERRAFLAASTAAAVTTPHALDGMAGTAETGTAPRLQVLEVRRYRLRNGALAARFAAYAKDALVPALGRAGLAPVGAWNVAVGPQSPTVHLLIPHPDADSVVTLAARLDADADYRKAAASVLAVPAGDPPFLTCDSSLHATVPTRPSVEKPAGPAAGKDRVFELRTYRSVTEAVSRRKIEMFEAGGELALFRRLGLDTVFFSRDLAGEGLPSLTYMLVFADDATREKAWATFRDHPEWVKLRDDPRYADTVSNIDSVLLRPTDYSQL